MKITNFHLTKNITLTILIIATLSLTSCGKDGPLGSNCLNGSWLENVETELNAWTEAIRSYNDDPSKANCENQKKAGLDYVKALEDVRDCVPTISTADFNDSIKEAEDELNATICN